MRGLVALSLVLTLASLSGCVSLVEDGQDPDLDAAAAEAQRAIDDYEAKAGHIAGIVADAAGVPLAGALVDLVGVQADLATDEKGHFAFLDLVPGVYTLAVDAEGFETAKTSVDVTPGQFARPEITLQAVEPAAYTELYRLDGYAEFQALGIGLSCYSCYLEGDLGEGLTELVLEADMQSTNFGGAHAFYWDLVTSTADYEDSSGVGGQEASPMRVLVPASDLTEDATQFTYDLRPVANLVMFQQAFTGYVSAFYYGAAPDDYSAFAFEG